MTIVVFIALFTLTTLEFGSASVRSIICRATYSQTPFGTTHVDNFAQSINASTLIASMLAMQDGRKASVSIALGRILHQSWKTQDPPPAYHSLIASWRSIYPDWTYVLWDNEDNLALVDTFYPEWRSAYDALPSDIYRAGFARNLYMYVHLTTSSSFVTFLNSKYAYRHTFGGIYADIDSEAITPLHPLLDAQKKSPPIAFLGAMDTSSHELHSIPNAFMAASAAGHPLWLVAAEDAVDWARARSWDHSVPAPGPGEAEPSNRTLCANLNNQKNMLPGQYP
jgi:mannosyltransferase OCH1-like enzyme